MHEYKIILTGGYYLAAITFINALMNKVFYYKSSDNHPYIKIPNDEIAINIGKLIVYLGIAYLSNKVYSSITSTDVESILGCIVSISASMEAMHCFYNIVGNKIGFTIAEILKY